MGDFCYKTAHIWAVVGYIILILKILVPIFIIVLGIIDLGKAVISDEKKLKSAGMQMVKRVIAGACIFFIPTIISYAFKLIADFTPVNDDYIKCVDCLTSPSKKCDKSYKGEIFKF